MDAHRSGDSAGGEVLTRLQLTHPTGGSVEIFRQGAHIASWRPPEGTDVLFLSRESRFERGVPIRGGIPVVFPQFSDRGPLPKHGFARTESWEVEEQGMGDGGAAFARLSLVDSPRTRALWPYRFRLELLVELEHRLGMTLRVVNSGEDSFTFTCALHTYFRVGEVAEVSVEGLQGARYLGTAPGGEPRPVTSPVRIEGETDGVYGGAPDRLEIRDPSLGRSIVIEKSGFPDAVVWNPWVDKARAMPDLGDDEYRLMLCVEAGAIADPVQLAPGDSWSATQILHVDRI